MYKHACKTGLEGVVSKVRDSRYVSGRVNDWVKKTCAQRETLAIAGFALDGGKWDGLYLGGYRLIEMLRFVRSAGYGDVNDADGLGRDRYPMPVGLINNLRLS
jgi:bifunctional non-homologous end joining protein LigD